MKHVDLFNNAEHAIVKDTIALNVLTLTGTSGTANVAIGGLTLLATWNALGLPYTAMDFIISHLETLKRSGFNATLGAQAQVETVTLTGTSGTANVTEAGGLTKLATFASDLTTTAANFVTAHAAAYAAVGITLTSSTVTLIFTAAVAGVSFDAPVVVNVTTNLAGTTAHTTPYFTQVITFTHVAGQAGVTITNVTSNLAGTLGAVYIPDFDKGRIFRLLTAAASTIGAPKNPLDGAMIVLEITAGGAHAITWNAAYQFAGGTEPTQTSSGLDIYTGRYNKTANKVYIFAAVQDVKA